MKFKTTARFISGCLSLALMLQLWGLPRCMQQTLLTKHRKACRLPLQNEWGRFFAQELGRNGDPVTQYVNEFDGEQRVILWTKGIKPPTIGNDESYQLHPVKIPSDQFQTYLTTYISNVGWYDVNKQGGQDANLCFAAAASNSLHWWLDQNDEYIQKYIDQNSSEVVRKALDGYRNSFKSQSDSGIFKYFIHSFANRPNGYWVDLLHDHFINGYPYSEADTPNQENKKHLSRTESSGFLMDIFGEKLLTRRLSPGSYEVFSRTIEGAAYGRQYSLLTYKPASNAILLRCGAEYDLQGNLCGVFLSDSDDYDAASNGRAMLRYTVNNAGGDVRLTTRPDGQGGSPVTQLHTLSLGKQYWQAYFGEKKTPISVTWSDTSFTYDGCSHLPSVSISDTVHGDVRVTSVGDQRNARHSTATAKLEGADASEYTITNDTQAFTINPAATSLTIDADKTSFNAGETVLLSADVTGIPCEKRNRTITITDENGQIGTVKTTSSMAKFSWKKLILYQQSFNHRNIHA